MSEAVLGILRDMEARLDRIGSDLVEMGHSLTRTEAIMVQFKQSFASMERSATNMEASVDRMDAILDRIDRRLDLRDARQ